MHELLALPGLQDFHQTLVNALNEALVQRVAGLQVDLRQRPFQVHFERFLLLDVGALEVLGQENGRGVAGNGGAVDELLGDGQEGVEHVLLLGRVDGSEVKRHQNDDGQPEQQHVVGDPVTGLVFGLVLQISDARLEVLDLVGEELHNGLVVPRLAERVENLAEFVEIRRDRLRFLLV